jgi:activator of 2-hydroxyglutaryl-CoA dehydratase
VVNLLERVGIEREFTVTGGIAKNRGVKDRLLKELGLEATIMEPDSQLAGAIGGALFARDLVLKTRKKK